MVVKILKTNIYLLYIALKYNIKNGEMAEWLKASVLKTDKGATSSRVRIPLSPHIDIFIKIVYN